MNAPANRSPTETVVGAKFPRLICTWLCMPAIMSPMKISTVEGGMIWPSVPLAQMDPHASFGSYPARNMAGSEISPIVTTVCAHNAGAGRQQRAHKDDRNSKPAAHVAEQPPHGG